MCHCPDTPRFSSRIYSILLILNKLWKKSFGFPDDGPVRIMAPYPIYVITYKLNKNFIAFKFHTSDVLKTIQFGD